ncbi:MAG: sulfate transporter CysZ [Magnetococcales bacterium]|nr:sulfate transporter CysZ [Magnetococcales bacterium]
MIMQPLGGAACAWKGLALIFKPGLRLFALVPVLINTLLFGSATWLLIDRYESLWIWVKAFLPTWLHWLEWLFIPVLIITTALVIFFGFTLVANLVGAPFNGLLAECVEAHLTGRPLPATRTSWKRVLVGAIPAMAGELGKLLHAIKLTIPALLLLLIPGFNLAAPVLWTLITAWLLAIEYADFPLGNHDRSGVEIRRFLAERRLASLAFGATVLLMTAVPLLNLVAMPAAVAGATVLWVERREPEGAPAPAP